jgi:hypothetical protein
VAGKRRPDHYKFPQLRFGHVCLTLTLPAKRASQALVHDMPVKDVSRAELAVCMGFSRAHPGSYDFLLANGEVVPRSVVSIVNVTPFDWHPRRVLQAELWPPAVGPRVEETVPLPLEVGDGGVQGPVQGVVPGGPY